MKRKSKSRNRIGYQQLENRCVLASIVPLELTVEHTSGEQLIKNDTVSRGSADQPLPARQPSIASIAPFSLVAEPKDAQTSRALSQVSSEPLVLRLGEELRGSTADDGNSRFQILIEEPGNVSVHVGQTGELAGDPKITIFDDLGVEVASQVSANISLAASAVFVTFSSEIGRSYTAVVGQVLAAGPEPIDFVIRAIGSPSNNITIPGQDSLISSTELATIDVPQGSVGLLTLDVDSLEPVLLLTVNAIDRLSILSPSGERVSISTQRGNVSFTPETVGSYTIVAFDSLSENRFQLGVRAFTDSLEHDRSLIPGLDRPLQNGDELDIVVPPGGIAVLPLDFAVASLGRLSVVSDGSTPFLDWYDIDGERRASNAPFSASVNGAAVSIFQAFGRQAGAVVVTNPDIDQIGRYTIRVRSFQTPIIAVPDRDVPLTNGATITSNFQGPLFRHHAFQVDTPGTFELKLVASSPDLDMILYDPNGRPFFGRQLTETRFEYDASIAGRYQLFLFISPPEEIVFEAEVTLFGISENPPAPVITSVIRDGRSINQLQRLDSPDRWNSLDIRFDQDVHIEANALVVRNDTTGGQVVDISGASFTYDPLSYTANWDLSTLATPLAPGFYSATISGDDVSSSSSDQSMQVEFFNRFQVALPGDIDFDGTVDVLADAFALIGNLGTENRALWSDGDFNGDGVVDVLGDAFALVGSLNRSTVPPEVTSFQRDGWNFENDNELPRPDLVENLTVDFSVDVNVDPSDLILRNESKDSSVDLSGAAFTYDATMLQAQWDLTTLAAPLPAGFYSVQILADSVTEKEDDQVLLADYADQFYVALAGDTNLDGTVNVLDDAFALVGNLGLTEHARWTNGDFNGDGIVNVLDDAFDLIGNLGVSVNVDNAFAQFGS